MSMDGKLGAVKTAERCDFISKGVTITIAPPRTIKIIVNDPGGKPAIGAEVHLTELVGNSGAQGYNAVTDSNGEVSFDKIYKGARYSPRVKYPGCYDYNPQPTAYITDKNWKNVQKIKLTRADTAKGKVVDEQGNPLDGVTVELLGWYQVSTNANANGEFLINVPPQGELEYDEKVGKPVVMLRAADNGRGLGVFEKIDRESIISDGITLVARPFQQFTVVVKNSVGRPMEGVNVNMFMSLGSHGDSGSANITNANGEATRLDGYWGAVYNTMTDYPGYYAHDVNFAPIGGKDWKDRLEIILEPANRIQKGRVVDEAGKPVTGAEVKTYIRNGKTVTSDAAGKFTLKGLPDSKIRISAQVKDKYGSEEVSKGTKNLVIRLKIRK